MIHLRRILTTVCSHQLHLRDRSRVQSHRLQQRLEIGLFIALCLSLLVILISFSIYFFDSSVWMNDCLFDLSVFTNINLFHCFFAVCRYSDFLYRFCSILVLNSSCDHLISVCVYGFLLDDLVSVLILSHSCPNFQLFAVGTDYLFLCYYTSIFVSVCLGFYMAHFAICADYCFFNYFL